MKIASRSTLDRLSELPSSTAENILIYLPLQDAVRTSILSRKWRYRWEKVPHLNFDDSFYPKSLKHTRDILMKIYEILLTHQGPILGFSLSIQDLSCCSEIGKMIRFLSRNGIQEFRLLMWKEEYRLPSDIFFCPKLRRLYLRRCEFEPPRTFKGFSKLVSLDLWETAFPPDVHISNCPLLESLKLNNTTVIESFSIDAPRMKLIWFIGVIKSIGFINTPLLAVLSFEVEDELQGEQTFDLIKVIGCLPLIEYLYMDHTSLMSLALHNVPRKLPSLLNNLRSLELTVCFTGLDGLSCTICLIRSSPNLQLLSIEVAEGSHSDVEPALEHLGLLDCSDFSLDKLREVQISLVEGSRAELNFIKFLLAKSPALEKMCIEPATRNIDVNCFKMLIEFTRFQRASQRAEIIFPRLDLDQA